MQIWSELELIQFKDYKIVIKGVAILNILLWKHAYSGILRILPPKNENCQMKNSGSLHISAQTIDCKYLLEPARRGGSIEYPQSMSLRGNKKINVYPC